ncbi:unnamed protein product [Tetraodon nigroviridis]|uniref:(spotted green pufferfish) hypothetical protein n=1 Tax=Tetraodon nigroviridis TaxID=99883 RepID=Q4RP72_TETNG|nr:unnamed protein product [Tetraodon nigroviridis]
MARPPAVLTLLGQHKRLAHSHTHTVIPTPSSICVDAHTHPRRILAHPAIHRFESDSQPACIQNRMEETPWGLLEAYQAHTDRHTGRHGMVLVSPEAQAALRCSDAPFLQCCLNVHISLLDNGRKRRIGRFDSFIRRELNPPFSALSPGRYSPVSGCLRSPGGSSGLPMWLLGPADSQLLKVCLTKGLRSNGTSRSSTGEERDWKSLQRSGQRLTGFNETRNNRCTHLVMLKVINIFRGRLLTLN